MSTRLKISPWKAAGLSGTFAVTAGACQTALSACSPMQMLNVTHIASLPLLHTGMLFTIQTGAAGQNPAPAGRPNIIYFMADELGYYELSHMGHPVLRTPNIDRLAAEGTRFTQFLAGGNVCAPSRCSFLTGKHSGHSTVRGNGGADPLLAGEETVGSVLKRAGYATGGFGKWGVGARGTSGVPENHGFDVFFGYYDQVHAHTYYPRYLVRNSEEVPLSGNTGSPLDGQTFSQYRIFEESKEFIRANKDRPFFACMAWTPPHGIWGMPKDDPSYALYKDEPWPNDAKVYAAMINLVDREIGEIRDLLQELGIAGKTLIVFTGDNGGAEYFADEQHPRGFFAPNVNPETGVQFRGGKGNFYEGGLRVPAIVHWPGRIAAGRVSGHLGYFPDLLPTFAELAGAEIPKDADGLSLMPELLGEKAAGRQQPQHQYLYWEDLSKTAVRTGDWKALRNENVNKGAWELYDLSKDISETANVAAQHPDVLAQMTAYAAEAHRPMPAGEIYDSALAGKDRNYMPVGATGSWSLDGSGSWSNTANWAGGNIPGTAPGTTSPDTAIFSTVLTAPVTVTVDANRAIGTISFGNTSTNGYTLSGSSFRVNRLLVESIAGVSAQHNDTITSAIKLRDNTAVTFRNNSTDSGLIITGGITGDTANTNKTVVLDGTSTVSSQSAGQNNSIYGIISDGAGKVAVVKNGTGVWTLIGNNTFTGGLTVNAGTLRYFGTGTPFGNGPLTVNDGVIFHHANTTATPVTNQMVVTGNFTLIGGTNTQWGGTMDLNAGTRTITVGVASAFSTVISNGGLIKAGAKNMTLSGANTYALGTTVSAGTLIGAADGAFGTGNITVADGAKLILQTNASINDQAALVLGTNATLTLDFTGADTVGSISLDGETTELAAGTYDAAALSALGGGTYTGAGRLTVIPASVTVGLFVAPQADVIR
ncbi:MAG: sulfatase-like hydrolase/transferase [Kiritimatiellales bacterium]